MWCGKFFLRLQTTIRVHTPRPTSSSACLVLPYHYVLRIHFRPVLNFPLSRTKNLPQANSGTTTYIELGLGQGGLGLSFYWIDTLESLHKINTQLRRRGFIYVYLRLQFLSSKSDYVCRGGIKKFHKMAMQFYYAWILHLHQVTNLISKK